MTSFRKFLLESWRKNRSRDYEDEKNEYLLRNRQKINDDIDENFFITIIMPQILLSFKLTEYKKQKRKMSIVKNKNVGGVTGTLEPEIMSSNTAFVPQERHLIL